MAKSFNVNRGQYELQLLLASREISDLAIELAKQAGEEVGPLPTREQFDRALKAAFQQRDWMNEGLMQVFEQMGVLKED